MRWLFQADVLAIGLAKKLYGARLEITRALVESQREVRRVGEPRIEARDDSSRPKTGSKLRVFSDFPAQTAPEGMF